MESLQVSFLVLAYVSAAVIFVVGIFLTKLLIDLSKLSRTVTNASEMIQSELEPTLKELKVTAQSVNSVLHSADEQISGVKKTLHNAAGATRALGHKMGDALSGLVKGIALGFKLFKK